MTGHTARTIALVVFLGACGSGKTPPPAARSALADSADQVMWGAHFNLTDKGLQRAELLADTAYFFNENTRVELQKVKTTFYNSTGAKDALLTSDRGTYNSRFGNMVARRRVVVVSEDGRRLTTEELTYDQSRNEISSDSAFVLTEPNRQLAGIGFRSDPSMNNIRVLRAASGFAKGTNFAPQTAPPAGR